MACLRSLGSIAKPSMKLATLDYFAITLQFLLSTKRPKWVYLFSVFVHWSDITIAYLSVKKTVCCLICTGGVGGGGGGGWGGGWGGGGVDKGAMVCLCPPPLLTPHFYFPLELYVYLTLTNNYLAFFIYQLIILWTISINWHRWLLLNNHISKYNSFILVLYRRYINYVSVCPPPPLTHTHLLAPSYATDLYQITEKDLMTKLIKNFFFFFFFFF